MCLLQGTHRGRGRSQREQPHWPYFSSHQRCLWASAGNESFCFSQWTEKNVQLHQSHDDTKTQTISHDWRHSRYSHEPPCQSQTFKLIGSHTRQSLHEFLCCSCFKCVVLSGADSLSSYNGPIFHLWTEMSTNYSCSLWGSPQLLSCVSVHYLFFFFFTVSQWKKKKKWWKVVPLFSLSKGMTKYERSYESVSQGHLYRFKKSKRMNPFGISVLISPNHPANSPGIYSQTPPHGWMVKKKNRTWKNNE